MQLEIPSKVLREVMYHTYQGLATLYFGMNNRIDKNLKGRLTISDVLSKIIGLPSSSQLLKDIKIDEIKNSGKVRDDQMYAAGKKIRDCLDLLKSVTRDSRGSMRYATEDGVYYWIPEDYFP